MEFKADLTYMMIMLPFRVKDLILNTQLKQYKMFIK